MGVVYLARQTSLGRLVALKMLPADLAGDEVALARFRREVRALARCDHPHIVKVLASGMLPDGRLYYAMEYVPGCDLEQVWRELSGPAAKGGASDLGGATLARAVRSASQKARDQAVSRAGRPAAPGGEPIVAPSLPPLPEPPPLTDDPGGYARRVAALVRDAALALQAVHDQGLVHRDVKPSNLMLTADGSRLVLMDFGLAKGQSLTLSASRSGGLLGTLRYAAPEQLAAANMKVGPAADVRGLGVTLWELLTRRRLFAEAEDENALTALVLAGDVPRLRRVDPSLDRDLDAIVARATERAAADRIPTAGRLAEYLQLYLEGKPLPIRPPGPVERAARWVRRQPALAAFMALFVLSLVAGAGVSTGFALMARDRAAKAEASDKETKKALGTVQEQRDQLDDGNKRLEQTLAASLLRPLGHQEDQITAPEVEALWDLAALRREQERVRLLFVEQALQGSVTRQQLLNRADLAIHAAVGLDPARRRGVEMLLLERLRDPKIDLNDRTDCVLIGRCLDGWGPEFAAAAGRHCVETLDKQDGMRHGDLGETLLVLIERLRPDDAADLARLVRETMKTTPDPYARAALARAVAAMGGKQPPAEGARSILDAMNGTEDAKALRTMAEAYSTVAWRLGPDKATAYALSAADRIEMVTADGSLGDLCNRSRALSAMASWLGQVEAARRAEKDCQRLLDEMDKPHEDWERDMLVGAVSAQAPRLEPAAAADVSRRILDAMGKPAEGFLLDDFAEALSALAPRLRSDDAAEMTGQALEAMGATEDTRALRALAQAAAALEPWAGSEGKGRQAKEAAGRVVNLIGQTSNRSGPSDLVKALSALSTWLGPEETARLAAVAEAKIVGPLGREDNPYAISDWALGMAAVAPWLPPDAAARQASAAVVIIKDALHKTHYNDARQNLAAALSFLAPRLTTGGAGAPSQEVMEDMDETAEISVICALARALASLAPRLGSEQEAARQAGAAARKIMGAMGRTTASAELEELKTTLAVVIGRSGRDASVPPELWIGCAAGNVNAPPMFLSAFALAEASRPSSGRLTEVQLVDLLRMPTCREPARQVILVQLGWQCGRPFADMWEFVEWAKENRPDLDLTSPPVRPDSP
jgi:serine/threonine protein kinase